MGLCVTDLERSRAFYERALGFVYWWELRRVYEDRSVRLQLEGPLELRAVYLVKTSLVLKLLHYRPNRTEPWAERKMAEPGLSHIDLTVPDLDAAIELIEQYGGEALGDTAVGDGIMVRDPDGQLIGLLSPGWRQIRPPMPT